MKKENIEIKKCTHTTLTILDSLKISNTNTNYHCLPNNIQVLTEIKTNWNKDNTPDTYRIKCIVEYMLQV